MVMFTSVAIHVQMYLYTHVHVRHRYRSRISRISGQVYCIDHCLQQHFIYNVQCQYVDGYGQFDDAGSSILA